jgi:hypothetical protein
MSLRRVTIALGVLAAVALWLVRPGAEDAPERPARDRAPNPEAPRPRDRPPLEPARCPPDLANCSEATGRVIAVEAVDPDGDGDAHYVLAGGSITAPGLSVVDVPRELRPRRLPRIGDEVTAAGPVYTGSYGQRQIEAIEVRHRRR